jgi:hypothetical protein
LKCVNNVEIRPGKLAPMKIVYIALSVRMGHFVKNVLIFTWILTTCRKTHDSHLPRLNGDVRSVSLGSGVSLDWFVVGENHRRD